ncbi:MAG: flagellar biosynthetic protein FliR [Nitrospinaceae bacterium]|jgi:flagellar biosynthesis protein FliR|nr:flagellar biosynthetic protein FliR [Nitrospina sp.]MBT5867878.1 flagellar biosynthetic protein FliR [Nitrospinaceae bacterium]MBT6346556.1 flagellar biosynthetic protein FliR [Nitrospina sp.]
MDIFNLNYAEFERFLFIFFRVGALILFVPVLGSKQIPMTMKVGFILFIAIVIFPLVQNQPLPEPQSIFELAIYLTADVTIGLGIAFIARLIFGAVQVAGTVVDFQMGFGVVNVIDPQTDTQVSVTAQFHNILAILVFLAIDAHHFIIQAIVDSFFIINPAEVSFSGITPEYMLHLFSGTFTTAVKIAAPIMAILFFLSVGLGLVARTVPQMNVFIVGFPLQIGVGLVMVGLSMPFFNILIQQAMLELPSKFMGFLRLL